MNALMQDVTTRWLATLLDEIDGFDGDLFPPPSDVDANDTVVGLCPDPLKKFFSYQRFCERELKTLEISAQFDQQDSSVYPQLQVWHRKRHVTLELFWALLEANFNHGDHENMNIGIRKGWKVVRSRRSGPEIKIFGMPLPGFSPEG